MTLNEFGRGSIKSLYSKAMVSVDSYKCACMMIF